MMLAEAKQTLFFFFFFLVYLPRHRGRDGLRRDKGEKQGRQQRRKRVREEGWDATSSAQPCLRIQKGQTMIYIRAPQLSGFVLSVSISHTSRDRADLSKYNPPFKIDLLPTTKTKHTVYAMKSPVKQVIRLLTHTSAITDEVQKTSPGREREVFFKEASHHHANTRTWLR